MYNIDVDNYAHALQFFPDSYKTQKVRNKVINTYLSTIQLLHEVASLKKKHVIKLLIDILLFLILFLICIRLKHCVINQFLITFYAKILS